MSKKRKSVSSLSENKSQIKTARLYVHSTINASRAIFHLQKGSDENLRLPDVIDELANKANKFESDASSGMLENMLFNQCNVLESMFAKAAMSVGHAVSIPQLQTWSHIALKAQDNCRKTILALNELRNPKKTVFIKQTNQALNQQVNNHPPLTDKTENSQQNLSNELLSETHHATLNTSRQGQTIDLNQKLEAVAKSRR